MGWVDKNVEGGTSESGPVRSAVFVLCGFFPLRLCYRRRMALRPPRWRGDERDRGRGADVVFLPSLLRATFSHQASVVSVRGPEQRISDTTRADAFYPSRERSPTPMGTGGTRGRVTFTLAAVLMLLTVSAPVQAEDEPAPTASEPTGGTPALPPSPVEGSPPADAMASPLGLPLPGPTEAVVPPTPTFALRVHDGAWIPWVPNVPLPVDYNGDLALDGTLTVTVTDAPATACLVVDFRVPLSGGRDSSIEFQRGLTYLRLDFVDLPSTLTACSTGTYTRPRVTMNGAATWGDLSVVLTDSGRTTEVTLDNTPATLTFQLDVSEAGRVVIYHRASTSLRVEFALSSPNVRGTIDRLPRTFDGEVEFEPGAAPALGYLKYVANEGIAFIEVTWGASWQADYFTTTLHNLPYWLELIPTVDHVGGQITAVHLRQYSGGAYGPIYFLLRSDDVPYAFSADSMPATIWGASVSPGKLTGGQGSLRFQFDATGPVEDLRVEFGIEHPNAFGASRHYLLANVARMPSWVDATYRTDASSTMSFQLQVSASEQLPLVVFHLQLDYAALDLTMNLMQVPSWLDGSLSMSGTTYIPGAPAMSYRANAGTLDFSVDSKGFDFGSGRLQVSGINLPPSLDAWIWLPSSSHLGQLDLSTSGSGRLGELYIDANLPRTLGGQAAHHFKVDFKDLARLSIAFWKPSSCVLRACADFGYLDTGTFWWWNAPPVLFNITLWINYKIQQYESCWYGPCWVDKYSFGTSWPNGFAYYAGQYGLDGRPARAVGVPF